MISITLDRASYSAGETITATISMRQKKPVKARGLYATLSCTECKQVKTSVVLDRYNYDRDKEMSIPYSSHMETKTEVRVSIYFSQEKKISGEREFSGEEIFTAQFAIPQGAKPTSREFGHGDAKYSWKVSAKLDIPFAIDDNAEKEIVVEGL